MLYAGYVAISMNGLSNFYSQLNKGIGAAERIWEILDRECTIPIDKGIVPLQKPVGEVGFQNVYFTFPTRPESCSEMRVSGYIYIRVTLKLEKKINRVVRE